MDILVGVFVAGFSAHRILLHVQVIMCCCIYAEICGCVCAFMCMCLYVCACVCVWLYVCVYVCVSVRQLTWRLSRSQSSASVLVWYRIHITTSLLVTPTSVPWASRQWVSVCQRSHWLYISCVCIYISVCIFHSSALCGLRGWKNRPAPFPGRMS